MKVIGWFVVLNLFASPLWAQENLQPVVEAILAGYPSRPLSTQQLGEALNEVARRSLGWGLHRKSTGHRCQQPAGVEVSCDLLVHQATGGVFDVLIDADGHAVPTWEYKGVINTMANFVAPTGASPVLSPEPPPPVDLGPVYTQIAELRQLIAELAVESEAQRRLVQMQQLEVERLRAGQDVLAARPVYTSCRAGKVLWWTPSCELVP